MSAEKVAEIVKAHQKERAYLMSIMNQGTRKKEIEASLKRLGTLEKAAVKHGAREGWPSDWYGL